MRRIASSYFPPCRGGLKDDLSCQRRADRALSLERPRPSQRPEIAPTKPKYPGPLRRRNACLIPPTGWVDAVHLTGLHAFRRSRAPWRAPRAVLVVLNCLTAVRENHPRSGRVMTRPKPSATRFLLSTRPPPPMPDDLQAAIGLCRGGEAGLSPAADRSVEGRCGIGHWRAARLPRKSHTFFHRRQGLRTLIPHVPVVELCGPPLPAVVIEKIRRRARADLDYLALLSGLDNSGVPRSRKPLTKWSTYGTLDEILDAAGYRRNW